MKFRCKCTVQHLISVEKVTYRHIKTACSRPVALHLRYSTSQMHLGRIFDFKTAIMLALSRIISLVVIKDERNNLQLLSNDFMLYGQTFNI